LSNSNDYPEKPKEALEDLEEDLSKNGLPYGTG
jgi:hypothetical protein